LYSITIPILWNTIPPPFFTAHRTNVPSGIWVEIATGIPHRWPAKGSVPCVCDGPISSDGSWSREGTIWVPALYSTPTCTSSGGSFSYSSYANCYGGYMVNERLVSNETYPARPDTVLADEPGHLG
jgi:hypothetical protein